jgi:uncharacterized protein (TIGR02594 family)
MTTLEIQRRLAALGFDPGPLDGIRGRLTIGAIKGFQRGRGLAVDGIAGPMTQAALAGSSSGDPLPNRSPPQGGGEGLTPWYEEALRLKGLREAAGASDNPTILGWARRLRIGYAHDSVPWCGLFVAHCIAASLPEEPLPANPLGARNWLRFGAAAEPARGAILVFWRGSRSGPYGHVGFYAGEDGDPQTHAYHVLGGNQSDSVSITRVARSRLLGARWPRTAPPPAGGRVKLSGTGALSTNEA